MKTAAPRKLGIRRILGLGFLAVLAVLLLWNVVWRISNNRAVARLEAAARQRGEPVTVSELATAYPKVPDEENIHRALVKVWASEDPGYWNAYMDGTRPMPRQKTEAFDPTLPLLGSKPRFNYTNDLSAAELAAIREFLPANMAHMDAVRTALRLTAYSANYDFSQTFAMLMPELSKLKREAQFFAVAALDAIAAKDNPRAIAAIGDISRVGHCLKTDPTLIGQLVRIACYNITISTTERLLKERQLSEPESRTLQQILEETKPDDAIKRALTGERVFAWAVLDGSGKQLAALASSGPGDEATSPRATAAGFRMLRIVGMAGAEKRLMGETFDQAIRCLSKPDYATTDEMHEIFTNMDRKARGFPPRVITALLMPALEKAGENQARFEALRRCAITALEVERYRRTDQNGLPAELSALGAAILDDPFTGKPLLLKRTASGYVIYSVGPDHNDNDANLDPPKGGGRGPDIGFRVEHK